MCPLYHLPFLFPRELLLDVCWTFSFYLHLLLFLYQLGGFLVLAELPHAFLVTSGLAGLGWPQLGWHYFVSHSPSSPRLAWGLFTEGFQRVDERVPGLLRPKFRTSITSTTLHWLEEFAKAFYLKGWGKDSTLCW